jgi:hypothetical protein
MMMTCSIGVAVGAGAVCAMARDGITEVQANSDAEARRRGVDERDMENLGIRTK